MTEKLVKLNTRDFGEIEIAEENIFEFPNGVFAFEDVRHFALISPLGEDVYPKWLQSADALIPCFVVFDPTIIDGNYQVALTESEKALLDIKDDTNLRYLVIAKVPENFRETTVNMKSPIVINSDLNTAAQFILPHDYTFRLPIYKAEVSIEAKVEEGTV
ncbi:MAG: flagellar assembly protein FliW [Oscillospiraceae bacterium]|jgi:flagellar assembly factor FliW|nr:flagellar assembly protein FliW [Oscillospiraceae bacterium]